MDTNDVVQNKPTISEKLFEALLAFYSPAATFAETSDTKSTCELIEEMEQIQDTILSSELNNVLQSNGFKLQYNGVGYVWLLKTR